MIWFTADTHFGHKNIIRLCNRPFKDQHHMDEIMIANWNTEVRPDDLVYHLGDFGYKCPVSYLRQIMSRLNGDIVLMVGNHDNRTLKADVHIKRFLAVHERMEIKVPELKLPITLSHYPMISWNHSFRGAIQLYGHHHGRKLDKTTPNQLDVGVDVWDFKPVSLETIITKIKKENETTNF